MTDEELFTFDLQGYLIVRGVLSAVEVAALHAIAMRRFAGDGRASFHRAIGASAWGAPYQALVDHPTIVPYLVEVLGPKFRLEITTSASSCAPAAAIRSCTAARASRTPITGTPTATASSAAA